MKPVAAHGHVNGRGPRSGRDERSEGFQGCPHVFYFKKLATTDLNNTGSSRKEK